MAQTDLLKRYLDAGVAITQMTQQKAEQIVRDLVRAGEVQSTDARQRVEELLDRSRQTSESVLELVRTEVRNQIGRMGLVPQSEVDELRRELEELRAAQAAPPARPAKPVLKGVPAAPGATPAAAPKAAKKAAPAKKATKAAKKASPAPGQ